MRRNPSCGSAWQRLASAFVVGTALCASLALVACGSGAAQSASSSASQDADNQTPSESYLLSGYVITGVEGYSVTVSAEFDDQGRQLSEHRENKGADSTLINSTTGSEWDEYGHCLKDETEYDSNGVKGTYSLERTDVKLNDDGSLASYKLIAKDSNTDLEDDLSAGYTLTAKYEYADDVQLLRKNDYKTEYVNKSGDILMTETRTTEFDEDGLETDTTIKYSYSDGTESTIDMKITWTKDANGKPTSYELVMTQDEQDPVTMVADVELNDAGLVTAIKNMKIDGEDSPGSVTMEYKKFDKPLANAYEGWKSFRLSDYLINS